jgi:Leucine-rich repeat (LRR) protein
MTELSMLDLSHTNIAELPHHLDKMKSLKLLNLRETKIHKGLINKLKKNMPHTIIDN